MTKFIRSFIVAAVLSLPACMPEPIDFGAYPSADEVGVTAQVTREQARATAQRAFEGLNEADYAKWTTAWGDSMRDAISEGAFLDFLPSYTAKYGAFEELEDMRLTAAAEDGYVRYWALARFERGHLMLIHVYPENGDRIVGVHLRDAETGETP